MSEREGGYVPEDVIAEAENNEADVGSEETIKAPSSVDELRGWLRDNYGDEKKGAILNALHFDESAWQQHKADLVGSFTDAAELYEIRSIVVESGLYPDTAVDHLNQMAGMVEAGDKMFGPK